MSARRHPSSDHTRCKEGANCKNRRSSTCYRTRYKRIHGMRYFSISWIIASGHHYLHGGRCHGKLGGRQQIYTLEQIPSDGTAFKARFRLVRSSNSSHLERHTCRQRRFSVTLGVRQRKSIAAILPLLPIKTLARCQQYTVVKEKYNISQNI